jgi:hypothetical protein
LKIATALLFIGLLMVTVIVSVESVLGFTAQNSSSPFEEERKIPDFRIAAVGDMGCSSALH